jgi:hypothetical protein
MVLNLMPGVFKIYIRSTAILTADCRVVGIKISSGDIRGLKVSEKATLISIRIGYLTLKNLQNSFIYQSTFKVKQKFVVYDSNALKCVRGKSCKVTYLFDLQYLQVAASRVAHNSARVQSSAAFQ